MSAGLDLPGLPGPPLWALDWPRIEAELPQLGPLAQCPQDPRHHPEGDVLTHTRLACTALVASAAWRALPPEARLEVLWGCVLHDLGKGERTRVEDGRTISPGHAARSAVRARRLLAERGAPVLARERIVAMTRLHTLPAMALERRDGLQRMLAASLVVRCDHLALVAEADARGRGSADAEQLPLPRGFAPSPTPTTSEQLRLLAPFGRSAVEAQFVERVELFREWCSEHKCLERPAAFASDDARFEYFRRPRAGPPPPVWIGARGQPRGGVACEVVLMSGLPAAGKDQWIAAHLAGWPVVSLDAIRRARGVSPARGQGEVVHAARDLAREHLRARRSFVWSATNVTRRLRAPLVALFAAYGARVRIVYLEAPLAELRLRNRRRREAVPDALIGRLLDKLDFPDLTEAHAVEHVVY